MAHEMISVGIDVGTTTTQLVFSKLTIEEVGAFGMNPQARYGPARKPRAEVARKEVVYESDIYLTPRDAERIDEEALERILHAEYEKAGFTPQQVETGAIIITGEAVKTGNAQRVLNVIAPLAGDFVVTVAGPSLEAHLAGRGSGAAGWSRAHYTWATNVDIGGGTTNIAVFRQGDLMDASVIDVGGRHIEIDHTTGRVRRITKPGATVLESLGSDLKVGDVADLPTLRRFADQMAEIVVEVLEGSVGELGKKLLTTSPLRKPVDFTTVFISGGVSDCYYESERYPVDTLEEVCVYDDVGPLLASALLNHPRLRKWKVMRPAETVRATVMGASHETITVSGMTIWVSPEKLPMRNIPVIWPRLNGSKAEPEAFADAVRSGYERWDLAPDEDRAAIGMDVNWVCNYDDLTHVAEGVVTFAKKYLPPSLPVIMVMERDLGKALGQTVKARLPEHDIVSIDEIWLGEGDYIDIGRSLLGNRLVSLSVKTLIFPG
jgi:ethanolamine utilization protein EutA